MSASNLKYFLALVVATCVERTAWANEAPGPKNWANLGFPRAAAWNDGSEIMTNEKKKSAEDLLSNLLDSEVDCFGKQCIHADQCCKGSVCVDVDGSKLGTCLPIYGQVEGEPCRQDADCEEGLRCLENANMGVSRTCHGPPRDVKKKQYSDLCLTSSECDVGKGLCCQLQRRHRVAPRKVCYYFFDPKSCIGGVDPNLAKPISFSFNPFFKARLG